MCVNEFRVDEGLGCFKTEAGEADSENSVLNSGEDWFGSWETADGETILKHADSGRGYYSIREEVELTVVKKGAALCKRI